MDATRQSMNPMNKLAMETAHGVKSFQGFTLQLSHKAAVDIPKPQESEHRYNRSSLPATEAHKIGEGWKGAYYCREGFYYAGTTPDETAGAAELTANSAEQVEKPGPQYEVPYGFGYKRPEQKEQLKICLQAEFEKNPEAKNQVIGSVKE